MGFYDKHGNYNSIDLNTILVCSFIVLLAVAVTAKIIRTCKNNKKLLDEMEKPVESSPYTLKRATLISKTSEIVYSGSVRMPTHEIIYYGVFQDEDNEILKLKIPQEIYQTVYDNQSGTLVLQENEFFDFQ